MSIFEYIFGFFGLLYALLLILAVVSMIASVFVDTDKLRKREIEPDDKK